MSDPTPGPRDAAADLAAHARALASQVAERCAAGRVPEAQQCADAILALDEAALSRTEPAAARQFVNAAIAMINAADVDRGEQLLLKVVRVLVNNPQSNPSELIVPLNNLMLVYGQKRDLESYNKVAADLGMIAERYTGPVDFETVQSFLQLGGYYERIGSIPAAIAMYRQVQRYMTSGCTPRPDTLAQWVGKFAILLLRGGRPDEAVEACARAVTVIEQMQDPPRDDAAGALIRLGNTATALKDLPTAERAFDRAIALAAPDVSPELQTLAGVASHQLGVLLADQPTPERLARATRLFRDSAEVLVRLGRANTSEHAGEIGQQGVVAERRGDLKAAERLYAESVAMYAAAPDPNPIHHSDFLTDLGHLRIRRGRAADAIPPFRQALELRTAEPPARRATALSNLAAALFETGNLPEATRLYSHALDLRFDQAKA